MARQRRPKSSWRGDVRAALCHSFARETKAAEAGGVSVINGAERQAPAVAAVQPADEVEIVVFDHLPTMLWFWRTVAPRPDDPSTAAGLSADLLAAYVGRRKPEPPTRKRARQSRPATRLYITARWEPWLSAPPLEHAWPTRLNAWIRRRAALQYVSAYYSTIGGAFSALGRRSPRHARRAGELALVQSRIAVRLGDDLLAAQCRLYYAEALIHLGEPDAAQAIVARERQAWAGTTQIVRLCAALDALLSLSP